MEESEENILENVLESDHLLPSSSELSSSEEDTGLLKSSDNDPAAVNKSSKLFKSKREVFILIGLSLIIFSVQSGESIIAPFFAVEVR